MADLQQPPAGAAVDHKQKDDSSRSLDSKSDHQPASGDVAAAAPHATTNVATSVGVKRIEAVGRAARKSPLLAWIIIIAVFTLCVTYSLQVGALSLVIRCVRLGLTVSPLAIYDRQLRALGHVFVPAPQQWFGRFVYRYIHHRICVQALCVPPCPPCRRPILMPSARQLLQRLLTWLVALSPLCSPSRSIPLASSSSLRLRPSAHGLPV